MIYILFILPFYFILKKIIIDQWFLSSGCIYIYWLVNCAKIMNDSDFFCISIFLIYFAELYFIMTNQRRRVKLFAFFVFSLINVLWIAVGEMDRIFTYIPAELLVIILNRKHLWVLSLFLRYRSLTLLV